MSCMFYECSSLKELNLSNFNTNNITNMRYMFSRCSEELKMKMKSLNKFMALGAELCQKFQDSVSFSLKHKRGMGSMLDNLSNSKRRAFQERERGANKPNFVDFFAGAGGLSYGFTKAGFRVAFANDFEEVCIRTYKYNHPELPSDIHPSRQ